MFSSRVTAVVLTACMLALTACGGEEPAGPDVVGMNLVDARATLKDEAIEVTIGETDVAFGVLVEANFVVCEVHAVNDRMVRVDVAKRGC